jgi:hypothetical protein
MILKTLLRAGIVTAAVAGPMVFFKAPGMWAKMRDTATSLVGANTPAVETKPAATPESNQSARRAEPELEGPPVRDLAEVIRFDVSTGWVMSRWSRVSTGMAQLQLQGYRVPLVTGTAKDDLAGSLTYYFGPQQTVEKITFNGTTGDATKLIRLLTTRYGFVRRLANDSGLFVYEVAGEKGGVRSVLRIRPTGVVKASEPYQRFHVDLMMERPEKG